MLQHIHKCNRVFSRMFQEGKRITRHELLSQSRQRSDIKVTPEGELVKEVEI